MRAGKSIFCGEARSMESRTQKCSFPQATAWVRTNCRFALRGIGPRQKGVFDWNNPPRSASRIRAVMDRDGKVYYDSWAAMHGEVVAEFDLDHVTIDGGYIIEGRYHAGLSDTCSTYESDEIARVREFAMIANGEMVPSQSLAWTRANCRFAMQSNEYLAPMLYGPSGLSAIGPEQGTPVRDGIVLFKSKYTGSWRYVLYVEGEIVSALQVMTKDGETGVVAHAYTHPDFRRRGLATMLVQKAQQDLALTHSADLSEDAKAWISSPKMGDQTRTAKSNRVYLDPDERTKVKERFPDAECTFAKDDKGYYFFTHRARSKSYPSISKIPKEEVDFISSTS